MPALTLPPLLDLNLDLATFPGNSEKFCNDKCYLQNATVRFRMIATKSPNLRVPSFLIYLKYPSPFIRWCHQIIDWPENNNAHDFSRQPEANLQERIPQPLSSQDSSLLLGVCPEHSLPQLQADDEVLELSVSQPAQTGLLPVHGHHHLSTHLNARTGLDIVWNRNHYWFAKIFSYLAKIFSNLSWLSRNRCKIIGHYVLWGNISSWLATYSAWGWIE